MKRRLFKLFRIVSLLVCTAVVIMWGLSASISQFGFVAVRSGQLFVFNCGFGQLAMLHVDNAPDPDGVRGFGDNYLDGDFGLSSAPGAFSTEMNDFDWHVRFLGAQYLSGTQQYMTKGPHELKCKSSLLVVPCWLVCLATGWPLPIVIRDILRKFRRMPGFCSRCGYDLRATPERCPECGTARVAE